MAGPELVVIGGSAGGMKALREILTSLTDIGDCVVCVVMHRPPDPSPLIEVLRTYTAIPVHEPPDSPWPCPPGALTVAPAGYHLLVGRGRRLSAEPHASIAPYETVPGVWAHLALDPPVAHSRPSIDVTFAGAADFAGSAIAVLLSCANEDGAAGCAAVKTAGGRVVLQNPTTCEAPVAVNAALRRLTPDHTPDHIADPAGIGRWLKLALGAAPG